MKKTNLAKIKIEQLLRRHISILMLIVLGTITLIYFLLSYSRAKSNAEDTLIYSCESIGDNIDLQLERLDTILLNSINSPDLKKSITDFAAAGKGSSEYNTQRARLSSLLTALKGFDYSVRQLSVYSKDSIGYGVGDYIGPIDSAGCDALRENAFSLKGRKCLLTTDELYGKRQAIAKPYLSISRAYYDSYHEPEGCIEIRTYYDELFLAASDFGGGYDSSIVIYDGQNQIYSSSISNPDYTQYPIKTGHVSTIRNSISGNKELLYSYKMPNSGFTIYMSVTNVSFVLPIFKSLSWILLLFAATLMIGLILSGRISAFLTIPIKSIYDFLLDKNDEQFEHLDMEHTGIVEIDTLIDSINAYIDSNESNTLKLITLNEQEMQAQMLALQSQMNPHFLYNSLAGISEMAKEGLVEPISTMADNISQILRAISSNRRQEITLEEELELCDMFLECMQIRFGDNLSYKIDVEDVMLDFSIPKLCIQLLVENAIKAVTKNPPPWQITIRGYIKGEKWYVEVLDNGPGFSYEVDKALRTKMNDIILTKTLPSLKIEGMGILNIFIRFYLLDGIKFLFDFGNRKEGGAYVTVGRWLYDKSADMPATESKGSGSPRT